MKVAAPVSIGFRLVFRGDRRLASHLKGTVLGISLSLIPLVLVMVVSTGLIKGITARFLELGTFHMQLRSYDEISDWNAAAAEAAGEEGVTGAFPLIEGLGMLYSPRGRVGVTVKGVTPDRWSEDPGFREYMIIEEGRFETASDEDIVITRGVADTLEVGVGDKVKLLTSRTSPSGAIFLRPSFFTVAGVCSTGYYELDALTAYIPYQRGEAILRDQGTRYIGLKTADPYGDLGRLRYRLSSRMGNDWYLLSWTELQGPMYASFETSRNLILLIMALIVVVATLNISATLSMLVLENQEQIAILKATGSSADQIRLIFILAGLLTGLAGVVPGLAVGLLLAVNINGLITLIEDSVNLTLALLERLAPFAGPGGSVEIFDSSFYLDTIPVELDPFSLWIAALFTLAVAVIAAYLPASRAAAVRPLEILQRR